MNTTTTTQPTTTAQLLATPDKRFVIVKQHSKLAKALLAYAHQGTIESLAKERKAMHQTAIRASLPDSAERELIMPDGSKLASDNLSEQGKASIDLEKLKAEFPDAYAKCVTIGQPFRVMRLTKAVALLKVSKLKVSK